MAGGGNITTTPDGQLIPPTVQEADKATYEARLAVCRMCRHYYVKKDVHGRKWSYCRKCRSCGANLEYMAAKRNKDCPKGHWYEL